MKRLFFLLILVSAITSCGKKSSTESPKRRDLIEVVYASGNLYPQNEYKVISNVTGYLEGLLVKEGDSIQLNQALFNVSGPNRNSEQSATAFALRIADENASNNSPILQQLKEKLASARVKASNDSLTTVRYTNLAKSGAIAQADLDKVKTLYESSRREANALKEQVEAQERSLKVEAVQARNRFTQASNNLGDGTIRSMINGKVFEIYKQVGDFVHQNEVIALLGDAGAPYARLSIDESDMAMVQIGKKVLITLDAYPNQTFEARVDKVYPKLNKTEQSVRVDAFFTQTPPQGIYGLNLEANIIIRESKNALTIPRAALLNGDSIQIKRDGNLQKVKIKLGSSDLNYIEVLDGISERDEIVISSNK
jgi:multidrug efflux pump subunit AcrA (membrane-fusion protein)